MKKAKSAISGDSYENLLYICPEGIIVSDIKGIISFVSRKIYEMLDIPPTIDIRGRSILEFIVIEDRNVLLESMTKMAMDEQTETGKYIFMKHDMTLFTAEVLSTPVFDDDDKVRVSGFFSIVKDVSKEMKVYNELVMKEFMLDAAINGMAIAKFSGEVTYVNRSILNMWGYENENEMKGRPARDFWHDDHDVEKLKNLLLEKKSMVTEIKAKKKNGMLFDVQMAASVVRDDNGAPVFILGSFLDITEKKKAEEKILNSLKEKEILFKEIHHRVKNNLQIVSSLINLQMQNITDKMTADILIDCQNRILSMAKLHESLYQSENLMYINIPDYIRNIVMHLLLTYDSVNRIKIDVDIDEIHLGMDNAIPCGLLINEIISNSLKHGFDIDDTSAKKIDLSMKYDEKGLINLRIADNGLGISQDLLDKPRSLGMKLIYALVDQINGIVDINTSRGTEFVIKFEGKEN